MLLIEGSSARLEETEKDYQQEKASARRDRRIHSPAQFQSFSLLGKPNFDFMRHRLRGEDFDKVLLDLQLDKHVQVRRLSNRNLTQVKQALLSKDRNETAKLILDWTNAIALFPKKSRAPAFDTFCAEATDRRAARTLKDGWKAQLEVIQGISLHAAQAIVDVYPTFRSLVDLYRTRQLTLGP